MYPFPGDPEVLKGEAPSGHAVLDKTLVCTFLMAFVTPLVRSWLNRHHWALPATATAAAATTTCLHIRRSRWTPLFHCRFIVQVALDAFFFFFFFFYQGLWCESHDFHAVIACCFYVCLFYIVMYLMEFIFLMWLSIVREGQSLKIFQLNIPVYKDRAWPFHSINRRFYGFPVIFFFRPELFHGYSKGVNLLIWK